MAISVIIGCSFYNAHIDVLNIKASTDKEEKCEEQKSENRKNQKQNMPIYKLHTAQREERKIEKRYKINIDRLDIEFQSENWVWLQVGHDQPFILQSNSCDVSRFFSVAE